MKNKKAVNRLVILSIVILVAIIIVIIVYFYLTKPSIPPKLPDTGVPLENNTIIESPSKNITTNPRTKGVISPGGGGGGSSGGGSNNPVTPVIVNDSWGKRDIGGGIVLNENETPSLPSLKLSFQKFIDFIKGFFN
jgi:hypothetical protein